MGASYQCCQKDNSHFEGYYKPSSNPTYLQHSDALHDNGKENRRLNAGKDQNHTRSQDPPFRQDRLPEHRLYLMWYEQQDT